MADNLNLSLWFSSYDETEILPRMLSVLHQFPFSAERPGITYLSLHPVSWSEPTILEQRFRPGISPEQAILTASELIHDDYAYVFESHWDLWSPSADMQQWSPKPAQVRFIAQGTEFEDGACQQSGHIQVDFGLETPFLYEELAFARESEMGVRANVQKLVDFTGKLERNSGAASRLLWSESDDNLAQKLIARLQKIQ